MEPLLLLTAATPLRGIPVKEGRGWKHDTMPTKHKLATNLIGGIFWSTVTRP